MDLLKEEVAAVKEEQSEDRALDGNQTNDHGDETPNLNSSANEKPQLVTEDCNTDTSPKEKDTEPEQIGAGNDQVSSDAKTIEDSSVAVDDGKDAVTASKDCEEQAHDDGVKDMNKGSDSQSDKSDKETIAPIPIPMPKVSKEISIECDKENATLRKEEKGGDTVVDDKQCKSEAQYSKGDTKSDGVAKAEQKSLAADTTIVKENKQSEDKPKKSAEDRPGKVTGGQGNAETDPPNKERGGKSYSAQRSGSRTGKKVEEEPKKYGKVSAEVKASDGKSGYDDKKGGQTGHRRGKESDVRSERGNQRARDRDKPRGDPYKDKTSSERRRETDSRGSRRREEDHHKSRGREERMKEDEEKRKKEDEARKIQEEMKKAEDKVKREEEKKRQAEEQKRLDEENAKKREEEEEKHARDTHAEALERKQAKMALRAKNLSAASERPDEDSFVKLDSSLKKNTAFIRKLKTLSEQQKDSLTKEFQGLNLTKYVGEAAIAFSEAKLKMSDIASAVHLCSLFHTRYEEFSSQLLQGLQRVLPAPSKKEDKENKQQVVFDNKIRVELRFLAELIVNGIFTEKEGLPLLNNQLSAIMKGDRENHNYITIIISFTKHCGEDFAGIIARKHRLLAEKYNLELVSSEVFSTQLQTAYKNLLKDHYGSLSKYLERQHKDLQNMERQNRRTLQNKGELSEERRKKHEDKLAAYQKLLMNTSTMADLLDEDMPDLPVEELSQTELELMAIDMMRTDGQLSEFDWANSLWEDDDTRTFHENLINLRTMVPAILFKDTDNTSNQRPGDKEDDKLDKLEDDIKALEIEADEEEAAIEEGEVIVEEEEEAVEEEMEGKAGEELVLEEIETADGDDDAEEGEQISNATLKMLMDAYINGLPHCVNRDHIDKSAVDFCLNLNTKANRKKLAKALFNVPRVRLDLLPFYSRLVATLYVCMPDIATDLVERLKSEFRWHVRKKDQMMVESKIKVSRFIGELTKFKMCSKADTLQCLKSLIQDFRHHNIDMACALLESCGRFLYRSPDSHLKTNALLELMMRKKSKMHLNERHSTMIENAFFYCNPPEVLKVERKVRPPMHEYIRKLLYKDLSKVSVEKVLKQMRKLPWDNQQIKQYAVKCLSSVWNLKYNNLHCLANLLAGLVLYHDDAGIQVVDAILEELRIGMEINHPKYNQRRVSVIKFLGELYNYRMVESSVIFKTLYSLLRFGVILEEAGSPFDPPEHLFRIRLVCTMLDTCAQFFDRGSSKKKLDCFLVYFQQYILYKRGLPYWTADGHPFPMDVDNAISDSIEVLRPKLKLLGSLEEANKEVEQLEKDQIQRFSSVLPEVHLTIVQPPTGGQGLMPIMESNEDQSNLSQGMDSSMSLNDDDDETSDGEDDGRGRRAGINSASNSQSQNTGEEQEQEEMYGDYEESLTLDSAGEIEEDDNVTVITGGPKLLQCDEDEDFTAAFDKMLSENIQQRNAESMKVTQLDIGVPLHIKARTALKPLNFNPFQSSAVEEPEDPGTVNFVLMTRKGNKQQFKEFEVPVNSELAANLKNREEAEKAEKQRMKELTLHINERQEEEDYEEMLASMQRPAMSVPQTGKSRFHHPKGAPNTEQIFNAKGNRKW
nr:regulator of nonsense transcripts 2-like [Lytechinus pictus]